ncbi:response regulator [bacterium]|nr:response regulator [bacterium]|tara:strand:+ start:2985 stop:3383 length:399 start_codon:yes stop_codon:yes gene_type:complete
MRENKKYNILIVDDDEFLIDMYCLKFAQAGHTIRSAFGSEDAIETLKEEGYRPDAVVFDLVMPKMDGFELLKQIKEQNLAPGAALIVLSNQGEKEDLKKAREMGAVGNIVKANAIPSEVLTMVEKIIEAQRK